MRGRSAKLCDAFAFNGASTLSSEEPFGHLVDVTDLTGLVCDQWAEPRRPAATDYSDAWLNAVSWIELLRGNGSTAQPAVAVCG